MASVRSESGWVCSAKGWQVKIMVWNCIRLQLLSHLQDGCGCEKFP